MQGKLTLLFDEPYWVGIFERSSPDGYSAGRFVFGGEPTDVELFEFITRHYKTVQYSLPSSEKPEPRRKANFKRRQREAQKLVDVAGIGTRAQRALQAERERLKKARREVNKVEEDALEAHKFQVRREKRKEKHRGH